MSTKRKITLVLDDAIKTSTRSIPRKSNGIKGITIAEKSNDPLRDRILTTLRNSEISGKVEE